MEFTQLKTQPQPTLLFKSLRGNKSATSCMMFFIVLLSEMSYQIVTPLLPTIITRLDQNLFGVSISPAFTYSLIMSVFTFAVLISAPAIGYLSDKVGRKSTLILLLALMSISYLIMSYAYTHVSLCLFLLGRILGGMATCTAITQSALADIYQDKQRANQFSLIGFALTIAMVGSPLLSDILSSIQIFNHQGTTTPFYFFAILAAITLCLFICLFDNTNPRVSATVSSTQKIKITSIKLNKILWYLALFFSLELSWSYYFQADLLQFLALKYNHHQLTYFLVYIGLCMSIGLLVVFQHLLKKLSLNTIALVGILLISIFSGIHIFSTSVFFIYVAALPVTWGVAILYCSALSLSTSAGTKQEHGRILGMSLSLMALAWTISAASIGFFSQIHPTVPYWIASLLMGAFLIGQILLGSFNNECNH